MTVGAQKLNGTASTRFLAWLFFIVAIAFAIVAGISQEIFYLRLATEALIFSGIALSVDLLLGYTGLFSLGQALFFGMGAYLTALLLTEGSGYGFWSALGLSLLASTVVSLIIGAIAIRSKGVYFILITFGLAQVAGQSVYNTRSLGGSDGITGIPVLDIDFGFFNVNLGDPVSFFMLSLVFVLVLYLGLLYLTSTPFGRVLIAIRSNEERVRALGYNPWRYKLASYVIAADVAALAGTLYPLLRGFVSPELMYFDISVNAVIMVILGGTGTLIGPLYGSVFLIALKTFISSWTLHHGIVIGIIFMLTVIFFPAGFVGLYKRLATAITRRGQTS